MNTPSFVRMRVLSLLNPMTVPLANEIPCHPCNKVHIGIIALMLSVALIGDELLPCDRVVLPDGVKHQFE